MWFERSRFGHLDDEAFDALYHDLSKSDDAADAGNIPTDNPQQAACPKPVKQEKPSHKSVLKLSDFTHLDQPRKQPSSKPAIKPITEPTDSRWVLAVRTAESLKQGSLAPDQRERLMKLGKLLGLSPMDTNRIIHVIVQHADQGIAPDQLTRQSFADLEQAQPLVVRPVRRIDWFTIAMTTALLLLLEFAALLTIFR